MQLYISAKNALIIVMLMISGIVNGQGICVTADCKDTIRYPQDTVTLNGAATSSNGIASVLWKSLVGSASIDSPNAMKTAARKLSSEGATLYVFSFTATSGKLATATTYDSIVYIPNRPPVAITGPAIVDSTTTQAVLSGSNSTDPEGLALTYKWVQSSGPNSVVISAPTMANPIVSGLVVGNYVFSLTVTDSGGLTSTATQSVTYKITQVKTIIVTTKYFSDGSTQVSTVTTVP